MGDWNIKIKGVGCHHNQKPFDANVLAAGLVKALKESGHTIASAVFSYGDSKEDDLTKVEEKHTESTRPESD